MQSERYLEHQKNFDRVSVKNKSKLDLSLPTQQEIDECTARTRQAIEKLLESRSEDFVDSKPKEMYVKYTPSNTLNSTNVRQRIIKIVDKQVDPVLPPKFKNNQKTPALPDQLMSETAVLRGSDITGGSASSKTSLSKEERQQWNIPAAISNWKNQKGFAIAIDKRLASTSSSTDGDESGNKINAKFAVLAQSLHSADLKARQEIKARHRLKVKQAQQKKLDAEKKLQELALQASEKRKDHHDGNRRRHSQQERYGNEDDRQRISDRKRRLAEYEKKLKRSKLSEDQKILSLTNNDQRIAIGLSRGDNVNDSALQDMERGSNDMFVGTAPRFVSSSTNQLYDAPLFNQHEAISNIYTTKNSGGNTSGNVASRFKSFKGDVFGNGGNDEGSGAIRFTKEGSAKKDMDFGLAAKKIESKSRWDDDDE